MVVSESQFPRGATSKRFLDILLSGLGLLVLSPALLVITVLVMFKHGRPVLFSQERPGLRGKPFRMYKFRTMTDERDENDNLLPNEMRQTEFGTLLRSTSLDELPELWNVFKGDMSLVGPRPLLTDYLPYYTDEQNRRHELRPGITGWAQVNGRNAIDWDEKLALDIWYVNNQNFWLDIRILLMTVFKVLKRDDITPHEAAFTPRFDNYVKQKEKQS